MSAKKLNQYHKFLKWKINFYVCFENWPGVVALLDHDEGDAGLVVWLELDAGLANSSQLVLQDLKTKY